MLCEATAYMLGLPKNIDVSLTDIIEELSVSPKLAMNTIKLCGKYMLDKGYRGVN